MPLFQYRAVDSYGKSHEGRLDERNARVVTEILEERGLQVSSLEPVNEPRGIHSLGRSLSWEDVELLNDQLLSAVRSGMPITAALESVSKELHRPRLRSVLEEVRRDLEQGAGLYEAFQRQSSHIPPLYLSMIRAGEASGNLSAVLELMARHVERMAELKSSVKEAFAYPLVVLVVGIATVVFLLGRVIPVYRDVFADFDAQLPALTQAVFTVSDVVRGPGMWIGIAVVLLVLFFLLPILAPRAGGLSVVFDSIRMRTPIIGRIVRTAVTARFSYALGLLLSSGAPVIESLDLASGATNSAVLQKRMRRATTDVARGKPIADALLDLGYFSQTFCWMAGTAEQRGDLDRTLLDIASHHERSLSRMDRYVTAYLGPFLLLIVGCFVGVIIAAMYLPLFALTDSLGV